MRITRKMMSRKVMNNLNELYKNLNKSHTQSATGKAFQKPSEDPINAIRSMDVKSQIDRADQYATNVDEAYSIFTEAETSLASISDSLDEVKECLNRSLSGTYNDEDRVVLSKTVESMKEDIIINLNREYAGKYVFGGYNVYSPPFTTVAGTVSYNNAALDGITDINAGGSPPSYTDYLNETIDVQTGKATKMNVSIPGISITGYGPDNMLGVLDQVSEALSNPNSGLDLESLTEQVDDFFTRVQNHISSIGSKAKNLENMQANLKKEKNNLLELQSRVEDIDIEEAVVNFKTAEMVYQSALAVSAKIIQPTLVDFLR